MNARETNAAISYIGENLTGNIDIWEAALGQAKKESAESGIKERSVALHRILNEIASNNQYCLRLRK